MSCWPPARWPPCRPASCSSCAGAPSRSSTTRRENRALDASIAELPYAARAILATLAEIRRHNDRIGGWYADD